MKLMIVESPSKAKTIEKMLSGQGIIVRASYGHIRQLAIGKPREEVVNVNKNFEMAFELAPRQAKEVKDLIRIGKDADEIILASDPDREGEAIAWHLQEVLRKGGVKAPMKRVVYHEVTAQAVLNAIANPLSLNMDLVHAQKVRQALDYLVGFYLSPVLWQRISSGLSAGRVQSPALRLMCQRDKEIKAFIPKDFWSIGVLTEKEKFKFAAKLIEASGETYGQQDINTKELADKLVGKLTACLNANKSMVVDNTVKKMKSTKPKPPYTTSTLQQDGVRKLGYSSKKTMEVAQKLFEGQGEHGFITYMRTDAVNLSEEAIREIFSYGNKHLSQYMSKTPIRYSGKSKNAQEAHEAIRPTDMSLNPEKARQVIRDEQQCRLYEMIWQRTMACQMLPAQIESTTVTFNLEDMKLRTSGSVVVFPGYQAVYTEGADMDKEDEDNPTLPKMDKGDTLPLKDVYSKAHQTKAPPLYNDASMVAALEKYGIGRPSTYATIASTLADRGYIKIIGNRFEVTDMGLAVSNYLDTSFTNYVDFGFTAALEDKLDDVANGKVYHETLLHEFWTPFKAAIDSNSKVTGGSKGVLEATDELCPKCQLGTVNILVGKYGKYKSCSDYKKCDYRENMSERPKEEKRYVEGEVCPDCGGALVIRKGFKGKDFVGCDNYPTCKYVKSDRPKPEDTGKTCPKCKKNHIVKREGRRGPFYACSGFPKCKHIVSDAEFETLK